MTTTDNPLPVILIGLITAALLLLPPVGHDVKLPKDTVATQPPAPPGFAHWAAPTGESWKRAAVERNRHNQSAYRKVILHTSEHHPDLFRKEEDPAVPGTSRVHSTPIAHDGSEQACS